MWNTLTGAPPLSSPIASPDARSRIAPLRPRALAPDALAALLAGAGLLGGYLLRPFPEFSFVVHVLAMVAGGLPAISDAVNALRRGQPDVHVLMLTAAIGAAAIGRPGEGAALLFLFALSGALETYAMGRTRDAIRRLVGMRPTLARREDGAPVPVESLEKGDLFVVHPAEAFPLDGVVVAGLSSVDQSVMTGEAEPVVRAVGDRVLSGTLNLDGILTVRATAVCADSSLERVIRLTEQAQEEKSLASSERLADRVGRYYAPLVLVGGVLVFLYEWAFHRAQIPHAIYLGLTLLVAASPCALVLSSPAAILSALAAGGRRGLLIRSGSVLETLARIDTVAFDKTGTLTTGQPSVVEIWASDGDADGLLQVAAAAEAAIPHPLARALVRAAGEKGFPSAETPECQSLPGRGVVAAVDGRSVRVGRPEWVFGEEISVEIARRVANARSSGRSVVGVSSDEVLGLITLEDTVRTDASATLQQLSEAYGVRELVLLTGDHAAAGTALRRRLPLLSAVRSDQQPEDKAGWIRERIAAGRTVAMIGDGVNDAPALAAASVGITLGGIGSDVALDSADMVVMEDRLSAVPEALRLARRARLVALQNVTLSLLGVSLLVLAVLIQGVPLPLAVLFHEGTTVLVVLNGLRLLRG
ncbi:MAG: cation-translocating P-type ATPase [Capsulimonadales bacterium]|nr:cation-translocating P-type ATPase [Capsulimonadales bacterium]